VDEARHRQESRAQVLSPQGRWSSCQQPANLVSRFFLISSRFLSIVSSRDFFFFFYFTSAWAVVFAVRGAGRQWHAVACKLIGSRRSVAGGGEHQARPFSLSSLIPPAFNVLDRLAYWAPPFRSPDHLPVRPQRACLAIPPRRCCLGQQFRNREFADTCWSLFAFEFTSSFELIQVSF